MRCDIGGKFTETSAPEVSYRDGIKRIIQYPLDKTQEAEAVWAHL